MDYRLYIPKTLLYNWYELESFCEEQAPIRFLTVKKGLIYVLLKKSKGPSQAETTLTSNIIPLLIKNLEVFESEIKENSSQSTNSLPKEIHPILPAQRKILKILTLKKKKISNMAQVPIPDGENERLLKVKKTPNNWSLNDKRMT